MDDTLINNERIRLESHVLHIHRNDENDYELWMNTEVQDFDGLCIGIGTTRDAAAADAVVVFRSAIDALQQPPATPAEGE